MTSVHLIDYQDGWPAQFAAARGELELVFSGAPTVVEHIGSTSVPGLRAKPVIDILLGAAALAEVESRVAMLGASGYRYRPEYEALIPERRYFVRRAGRLPRIHLHAVEIGGSIWRNHLAFRNALRARPALADEYSRLKDRLAIVHANDKAAYSEAKAPFVARVLADIASPPVSDD